jgi:hypothetical protein
MSLYGLRRLGGRGLERVGVTVAMFMFHAGGVETQAYRLWSAVGESQDGV